MSKSRYCEYVHFIVEIFRHNAYSTHTFMGIDFSASQNMYYRRNISAQRLLHIYIYVLIFNIADTR